MSAGLCDFCEHPGTWYVPPATVRLSDSGDEACERCAEAIHEENRPCPIEECEECKACKTEKEQECGE